MKKTKIKSTSQFNKNNEVKSVCLGEIDHSVLMYDKENIDNISSNLTSDYIEKNAALSVEIFTEINSLSSSHNTDFNNLTNLIEKNIDFIQAISVDLSDDISNIVEFNNKISIINKNLDDLSGKHNLEIETLEKDISTLNEKFETFENELSNTVPEYETDPVFTEWKDECSAVIIGKDAKIDYADAGIAIGLNASSYLNSIAIGKNAAALGNNRIAIGVNTRSVSHKGLAIGNSSFAAENAIALGFDAKVQDAVENGTTKKSTNSIAIGQDAKVIGANNTVQIGSGLNTTDGTLQFRNYPLVDADGKIFEERIPDKIIKIIDDLSDITDLNDGPGIINFLSEKIDTDIANLSNEFNLEIVNVNAEINDLSGNITQDIQNLYDDLSNEIQNVNDSLSNEVFILNSKIDSLNNDFNSEISSIKADNILSICEIYDEINDLSGSITQDIQNLYNDLSDEIQNVNDAITDLSDTLSNEIFILNSKIDNLSNNLENSINESINNMIIDEVMENSNSLVKSSGIFKALQKDFVKIELSSDETIPLKNNTVYSITTETNEITPTLQFPMSGKGSDEILISIRSENSSGVKYNIDPSDNRDSLIYTQDGKLTFDHTADNFATVIKGEFDGLFWYVHDHIYKRVVDNTITIILSGKNNCGKIQKEEQIITITYDKMDNVKIDDYVNPDNWNFLFNDKCKLLGWTATETFSGTNPEFETDHIFNFTENDLGKVFTLYPIYEIEEVSITRITLGENAKYNCPTSWMKIDGKTINVKQYIIDKGYNIEKQFDGNVGIPFGFGVSARIKGYNDRKYSSASKFGWDASDYGTAFANNYTTLLDQVGIGEHSTGEIWLHNLTWTDGTQSITLYGKKHNDGTQTAAYQLFIDKIKIGFNRYNLFENCLNVPMFPTGKI